MDYYVYERYRKDNNTCFYVGRGRGNRYKRFRRNKLHDEICNQFGYYTKIIKDNLSKEESSKLEQERISYYVNELGYGINIGDRLHKETNMFLTNGSWGGEDGCFKSGELNEQYGVSLKERLGDHYDEWLLKTQERLCAQVGDKNPNYHNDTLHNKVKDNPELRIQYYSRPGEQNGRAVSLKMFDSNHKLIDIFKTIGDCANYIKQVLHLSSDINGMRSNIRIRMKKHQPYRGFYFEET